MFFDVAQGLDVASFLDYLSRAGVVIFLIIVIYGGYKRWWVFGWTYKESERRYEGMRQEKDAWRDTALESAKVATKAFREFERRT